MNALLKTLLWPPAFIYREVTNFRNALYDRGTILSYKSALPVVSVGNITIGGNGKTPLCLYLVEKLAVLGLRAVVLARGYGGKERGPWIVEATDSPERVGDEPYLISRASKAKVVVSRDRVAGVKLIESKKLGDVVILDDGFQHRRLRRDLDIVCIDVGSKDAVKQFVSAKILPIGSFRESRDEALKRADVIVLASRGLPQQLEDSLKEILSLIPAGVKIFRSFVGSAVVCSLDDVEVISGGAVFAFCGIAKPQVFLATLKELGFDVFGARAFMDHHRYTERDLRKLISEASGRPLVCTEKDAVKLQSLDVVKDKSVGSKIFKLKIHTLVDQEKSFLELILKRTVERGDSKKI